MAIDTITPAADNVLVPGDGISFRIDDTYTSIVISVETEAGWEVAYDSSLGGAQSGYSVTVEDLGSRHEFTVTRNSGWNLSPFSFRVVEDESGSSTTTSTSYYLGSEITFPRGSDPYYGIYQGSLIITDDGTAVRSDVGWLNIKGTGYTLSDDGNGKVTLTLSTGGGGGATTFVGLTDTPANYSGDATKIVRVNSGGTGLEFIASTSVGIQNHDGLLGLGDDDHTQYALDDGSGSANVIPMYDAARSLVSSVGLSFAAGVFSVAGSLTLTGVNSDITIREHTTAPGTPSAGYVNIYAKADGKVYAKDDSGTEYDLTSGGSGGSGDVVGPASATDNAIARFNATTGKLIQSSTVELTDNGNILIGPSGAGAPGIRLDVPTTPPAGDAGKGWWYVGGSGSNTTPLFKDGGGIEHQLNSRWFCVNTGGRYIGTSITGSWYGSNAYAPWSDGNQSTTWGAYSGDPTYSGVANVVPATGTVRQVVFNYTVSDAAVDGEIAVWKIAYTDGSGTKTYTKVASVDLGAAKVDSSAESYIDVVPASTSINAGDQLVVLLAHSTTGATVFAAVSALIEGSPY